jgi:hypothetical protein
MVRFPSRSKSRGREGRAGNSNIISTGTRTAPNAKGDTNVRNENNNNNSSTSSSAGNHRQRHSNSSNATPRGRWGFGNAGGPFMQGKGPRNRTLSPLKSSRGEGSTTAVTVAGPAATSSSISVASVDSPRMTGTLPDHEEDRPAASSSSGRMVVTDEAIGGTGVTVLVGDVFAIPPPPSSNTTPPGPARAAPAPPASTQRATSMILVAATTPPSSRYRGTLDPEGVEFWTTHDGSYDDDNDDDEDGEDSGDGDFHDDDDSSGSNRSALAMGRLPSHQQDLQPQVGVEAPTRMTQQVATGACASLGGASREGPQNAFELLLLKGGGSHVGYESVVHDDNDNDDGAGSMNDNDYSYKDEIDNDIQALTFGRRRLSADNEYNIKKLHRSALDDLIASHTPNGGMETSSYRRGGGDSSRDDGGGYGGALPSPGSAMRMIRMSTTPAAAVAIPPREVLTISDNHIVMTPTSLSSPSSSYRSPIVHSGRGNANSRRGVTAPTAVAARGHPQNGSLQQEEDETKTMAQQDWTLSNLVRDLEATRRDNERLLARNRRLQTQLRQLRRNMEENMIRRSRLIKACVFSAPVFVLCGGLDAFLSTVLLVWVLVEVESYMDLGDFDAGDDGPGEDVKEHTIHDDDDLEDDDDDDENNDE